MKPYENSAKTKNVFDLLLKLKSPKHLNKTFKSFIMDQRKYQFLIEYSFTINYEHCGAEEINTVNEYYKK